MSLTDATHRVTTYRGNAAFISDVHLGTRSCRAEALLAFLKRLDTKTLYLVGDIIDLERMSQSVHWQRTHSAVVRELFQLAATGTHVVYIPGNHDAPFRALAGRRVNGIDIHLNTVHETAHGERLLVTHGDQFDSELRIGNIKEKIGSVAYKLLMDLDVNVNRLRARLGYRQLNLARSVKGRIKSVTRYINDYEELATKYASQRGLDGVICGHIHKPCIRTCGRLRYFNTGDWVEHGTALVEDDHGQIRLVNIETGSRREAVIATAA
ncbi:MAG: UDP-2,3-diacylglucosamine diphosphatase [Pseudomonadota bacterium]